MVTERCGCILRWTYDIPCTCELPKYGIRVITMHEIHIMWTRLTFSDISSIESQTKLCIQKELDVGVNRFKEVDIAEKIDHQTQVTWNCLSCYYINGYSIA